MKILNTVEFKKLLNDNPTQKFVFFEWTPNVNISNFHTVIETVEPTFLFGIEVEIDIVNPYNVQLFEDITNKIRI